MSVILRSMFGPVHPYAGMTKLAIEEYMKKNMNGTPMDETNPKDLSYGKKPPISLVPPVFIMGVAWCMADGVKKRSAYNWRSAQISAMQTLDKILRHVLACVDGEDLTEDTKLSNLASAAADIAVYMDAQREGSLVDDRPKRKK